jgi:hypothetical protein
MLCGKAGAAFFAAVQVCPGYTSGTYFATAATMKNHRRKYKNQAWHFMTLANAQ